VTLTEFLLSNFLLFIIKQTISS